MGNNDDIKGNRYIYSWILGLLLIINQATVITAAEWLCSPKNISVPIGSNVTICCQVTDNRPTIIIKDNGVILSGDSKAFWTADQEKRYKILESGKLLITNVQESDDSTYGCSSSAGNKQFRIVVQLPPSSPYLESDKKFYQSGNNAVLTCQSTGKPAPTIYWISQGARFTGSSNVVGRTTTNTLKVRVDRETNKQNFVCFAFNDVNTGNPVQKTIKLDVQYKPYVVIQQKANRNPFKVIENTRMTLTCVADANPPVLNVKWIKNSRILKESTPASSDSYYSQNVSQSDNGTYECQAENSLGKTSDFINLEVLYYPRVFVKPKVEVSEKKSVILNCSADANPPATIRWLGRNNEVINDDSYFLNNVRTGDAGKYTCEAQNNLQSSTGIQKIGSATAVTRLYVKYKPGPAILRIVGKAIKGEDIVLICDMLPNTTGYPPPSFMWRKLGKNYFSETSKKLVIANATLSDSGQYTCNAKNEEGIGTIDTLDIKVKEYPEFKRKLTRFLYLNVTDQSPKFICKAKGNPSPNITWYKDGHPVSRYDYVTDQQTPQSQGNSFIVTSFLHFNNFTFTTNHVRKLRQSDTGNYSCVVRTSLNPNFILESTLQLIVKSSPQVNSKNEIVAITLNDNASVSVIVHVYPPPKFYWSKNNRQLRFKNVVEELGINKFRSTVIIPSATRADLGVYKCYINNTYGFVVITRDIRERSVPDPPRNLSSVDATWESVYLSWIAGFNGGEKQTFIVSYSHNKKNYSLEVAAENTGYIYYNVTNLMPDTTYNFSVQGRSIMGMGKKSNSFSVHTIFLTLPTPKNVKYIVAEKRIQFEVKTDYECCTSLLIAENGDDIQDLRCNPTIRKGKNNTVDLPNNNVEAVSVGLCLKRRNELCGNYIQATKVEPSMSAGPLSTLHVIIIAVVCGIILIILVVVLILFLYWRSRNQKKQYGNEVNYPHMSNGNVPNGVAGRQGYDNPDGPYSNGYVENTHNTSSEHTDELPPYTDQDIGQELSDESDLDKPYDSRHINDSVSNELPPSYSDVCRSPPEKRKPGAMTFYNNPHNIARNPNFISLNPEGMPRDTSISGRESGYSTPDSTRPKKWHKRNDSSGKTYYSQVHQLPHDTSAHPCIMPCCVDDLKLESSPKRSSCLPIFGLSRSTDKQQDHRRLLWNRPLLSTKNFSFPRLGTRQMERKNNNANSDKSEDKDLELVSCGIKPPQTKGKCQTLHFDFSRNESQDEEADEEERNKSSDALLDDISDQEQNMFRRSKSTFMPIAQIAETKFNTNSSETETKLPSKLPPVPRSVPQYRTSPLARRYGKAPSTTLPSYQAKSSFSSLYTTPICIHQTSYQTNSSIYSSKYTAQVEPYYATVQKPRSSVVSTVSSLQSSETQFGSNSSMASFSSPLLHRKTQQTPSILSYSTITTSLSSSGNITYESKYTNDPPALSMYSTISSSQVKTVQDTKTKYADVTSLMTSKYSMKNMSTMPIRTQFNRLASQVASKKTTKGILKNSNYSSQSSMETQSSTTHFPVYESIDDIKFIDDTSSEPSPLMEQKIGRQEPGRSKLANPTQNNNSTRNNKNAVSLVL